MSSSIKNQVFPGASLSSQKLKCYALELLLQSLICALGLYVWHKWQPAASGLTLLQAPLLQGVLMLLSSVLMWQAKGPFQKSLAWTHGNRSRQGLILIAQLIAPLTLGYFGLLRFNLSYLSFALLSLVACYVASFLLAGLSAELTRYLFFGALTTLVSLLSFSLAKLGLQAIFLIKDGAWFWPQSISFVLTVLFAFESNRRYVFFSRGPWFKELLQFASSRILTTLIVEYGGLWLTVTICKASEELMKLILAFAVVLLNYLISKFWVFTHREHQGRS